MTAPEPLLEVSALTKTFGGIQALDGISLNVRQREILGIVGPNGAGKTALVNCISGFYRASAGSIYLLGNNITQQSLHRIGRLGIARTFQNIRLFSRMTVLENVTIANRVWVSRPLRSLFARDADVVFKRPAMEILDRMHLADKADVRAGSLSYGEARRLEIARALATQPKLLLLDEPSAGMNEQETEQLIQDVRNVFDLVASIVTIEHDIRFIRALSHRVVAMDYGRKLAEGSPAEVFSNRQVIDSYLGAEHTE